MARFHQINRAIQIDLSLGDPDLMLIRGFHGTEAVSRLYEYRLDLMLQAQGMPFDDVMGKKATVSLEVSPGVMRKFHGIVTQLSRGSRDDTFTYFRGLLRPKLWRLTKSWNSRIYQDKNVVDILQDIFTGFDVDYSRLQMDEFENHNYRVQYRESDFNFASRLMVEAGICYFFEHGDQQEKLILMNARMSMAHPSMPIADTLQYHEERGATLAGARISSWEKIQDFASGVERLRDHHFQLPTNQLKAEELIRDGIPLGASRDDKNWKLHVAGNDDMEVYDYPGEYAKRFDEVDRQGSIDQNRMKVTAEGLKIARLRMEQVEAGSVRMAGLSGYHHLASGYKFQLAGHFQDSDSYMMTEVEHSCSQPVVTGSAHPGPMRYDNRFTCIPGSLPYRPYDPALNYPVAATQTAKVVGPSGQEIFTDRYGRVKVQFFWDRLGEENQFSSCWLRVAQAWAGATWGHQWIPRIGHEVIVDYLEGDMDQPIVTGSVYNKDNPPPWIGPTDDAAAASQKASQSGIKTRSTPGGGVDNYNELRFEDRKGHEVIYLHAERNLATSVEHNETHSVGVNQTITIGNDRRITVGGVDKSGTKFGDEMAKIFRDKHLHVLGTSHTTIDGSNLLHIKGDDITHYDSDREMQITGDFIASAKNIELSASTSIKLIVGGNAIVIDAGGVTVIGTPLIKLNPNGELAPLPTITVVEGQFDAIDP
jgi:type VI secretion system secreted protein VgrG